MKKKKIMEILDSNEVIIGTDDQPQNDLNAITKSNQTTDRAVRMAHQPFDDRFWGTFGFSIYENLSEEEQSKINTLSEDEMIKIAEDIISKRTDKSMKPKMDSKEFVSDKAMKIKDLFKDLSDREKADLMVKIKENVQ
jgi:hypothetical protein